MAENGDSLSSIATAFVVDLVELQVRGMLLHSWKIQAEEAWGKLMSCRNWRSSWVPPTQDCELVALVLMQPLPHLPG